MPSGPLTVVIAEDQALLRLGMAQTLKAAGYSIVAETSDGETTLAEVRRLQPSVLLIKKDLPGTNGVRCAKSLRAEFGSRLAIIVTLSSPADFWQALESTANGYILRETKVELLPNAVKQVDSGLGWIGPNICQYLLMGKGLPLLKATSSTFSNIVAIRTLSDREQEVMALLANGSSNQQIADALGLKLQTVKVHIKSILKKLKADSRSHAISLLLRTEGSANTGAARNRVSFSPD